MSPTTVKQETGTEERSSEEEGAKKKPGKILIQQSVECPSSSSHSSQSVYPARGDATARHHSVETGEHVEFSIEHKTEKKGTQRMSDQ